MSHSFGPGDDGIYQCHALNQFSWQRHGFGTRHHNPQSVLTLRQIHSNKVWNAFGLTDRQAEGDALVTDQLDQHIGVRTADCVPLLMLDSRNRAVAAVHAGWRGTASQVANETILKMAADFGSHPADLWVAIGPCIRQCCYEVDMEVADQFTAWTELAVKPNGKCNLNLVATNFRQLTEAGIPVDQIFDSGLCSFCESETFYSFRRQPGETGRMISAIALV